MNLNSKKLLTLLFVVTISIFLIIWHIDSNKTEFANELEFINSLNSKNTVCFKNENNDLLTCNNIIEEKYSNYNDLYYIKTKEKEYNYELLYDSDGIRNLIYGDKSIEFYYNNGLVSNIKYKSYDKECDCHILYKNSLIEYDDLYIKEIKNTDMKGNIISLTIFNNKLVNNVINVEETTIEDNKNKLIRYYKIENNNEKYSYNAFSRLNYIPNEYYQNNPYLFVNSDDNFSEYTLPFIKKIDKLEYNNEIIEYYYNNDYIYSNKKDFLLKIPKIKKNENNSKGFFIYKINNKYYKIKIVLKKSYIEYYEFYDEQLITEEEYNRYFIN